MSILIEGMKMPTGCISCDFCNPFVEEPYCRRLMKRVPKVTRLDNCPLIEVPEPHGRLIDADTLADSFEPSDFWNPDAEDNCFAAVRIVHSASTIIPASEEGET